MTKTEFKLMRHNGRAMLRLLKSPKHSNQDMDETFEMLFMRIYNYSNGLFWKCKPVWIFSEPWGLKKYQGMKCNIDFLPNSYPRHKE